MKTLESRTFCVVITCAHGITSPRLIKASHLLVLLLRFHELLSSDFHDGAARISHHRAAVKWQEHASYPSGDLRIAQERYRRSNVLWFASTF